MLFIIYFNIINMNGITYFNVIFIRFIIPSSKFFIYTYNVYIYIYVEKYEYIIPKIDMYL